MNTQVSPHTGYRPLQPTVGDNNLPMRYREFAPSPPLKPYVHCYWVLWSATAFHSSFSYRIVSDGCIDLFINCTSFEHVVVAGTATTATTVTFDEAVEYFGIRFFPGSFYPFFPLPLKDLTNKMIPCHDVWGNRFGELESRLFSATSTLERIEIAESFLIRQLVAKRSPPDSRLLAALGQMYHQQGQISIEKRTPDGISPRQLRRLFDRYIGIGPKSFARIVRFQSVLRAMRREPKQAWGDLYFDFGYYDQAHFIHEFKEFFGLSPMAADFSTR